MNGFAQVVHKDAGWTVWFDETGDQSSFSSKDNSIRRPNTGGKPDADGKDFGPSQHDFLERMAQVGSCQNYEEFRNVWRQLCDGCKEPPVNTNVRVFRDGLKPLWEDPANAEGGKFVICIGTKEGGTEKFLAVVSALMANDLSDAAQLTGAVLSSRAWGHTLSLWHSSARPGDRAAQMIESELRALLDEVTISFHQHRKTINYHTVSRSDAAAARLDAPDEQRATHKAASAPPRVAPRMSLRQRKAGVTPVKSTLGNEMARLEARWSANKDLPPKASRGSNELMQMLMPTHWSTAEISAALGAAVIAFGLAVMPLMQ